MIKRRDFLRNTAALSGIAFGRKFAPLAVAQTNSGATVEVLLDEPLGTISPEIYGHFAENLSGVIYDGIWVGEKSKVPNVNGIRKQLIDEMRKIKPAIVRFPGGCFADSYDWRDGVGPIDKRPRRTNFWFGGEKPGAPDAHRYDPNRFGTNEFVQFCRLVGGQPYLAANLRSLSAEQFYQWVEYCNSPAGSTTLAEQRAAAGFKEPFNVRYWGWETNRGDAAAILRRRSMQLSTAGSPVGCRDIKSRFRSSHPVRTMTIGIGRADSLKKLSARGGPRFGEFMAWHFTITPGT